MGAKTAALSRHRKSFIESIAEEVLDSYGSHSKRRWVDVDSIVGRLGISKSFNDYGSGFDGMLECKEAKFHVYVNRSTCGSGRYFPRARFTIAHELGHYSIPEHRSALLSGKVPHHPSVCGHPNPRAHVELEADYFASRLLMPRKRFDELALSKPPVLGSLLELASEFRTSIQSTALRLLDASEEKFAFLFWKNDGSFHWGRISRGFRQDGYVRHIREWKEALSGSATDESKSERKGLDGGPTKKTSVAYCWFEGLVGEKKDLLLCEEAYRTQFYTLTWLTPMRI